MKLCEESIMKQIVIVPEPVAFNDAQFLTSLLSCEFPTLEDNFKEFYSIIETSLNLQVNVSKYATYHEYQDLGF